MVTAYVGRDERRYVRNDAAGAKYTYKQGAIVRKYCAGKARDVDRLFRVVRDSRRTGCDGKGLRVGGGSVKITDTGKYYRVVWKAATPAKVA